MNAKELHEETFWGWLFDYRGYAKRPLKPIMLLSMLSSLFVAGYKIYSAATQIKTDYDLTLWSLAANAVVLIIAIIWVSWSYSIDENETKKNIQEYINEDLEKIIDEKNKSTKRRHTLEQKDQEVAVIHGNFLLYTDIEEFVRDHKKAEDLVEAFRKNFRRFLFSTLFLYAVLGFDVYVQKHNSHPGKYYYMNTVAVDDSVIAKNLSNVQKQIDTLLQAKKRENFEQDSIKITFNEVVNTIEKTHTLTYDKNWLKDISEFAITLFNNIGIVYIYACFLVLFSCTLSKNYEREIDLSTAAWCLVAITSAHIGLRCIEDVLELKIHRLFRVLSGLGNATFMALLYGKFNARHFKPSISILLILFVYATSQTLFCMFDFIIVGRKYLIMDITVLICLFGKSLLILYFIWLKNSNQLYYYFLSYPRITNYIKDNWAKMCYAIVPKI